MLREARTQLVQLRRELAHQQRVYSQQVKVMLHPCSCNSLRRAIDSLMRRNDTGSAASLPLYDRNQSPLYTGRVKLHKCATRPALDLDQTQFSSIYLLDDSRYIPNCISGQQTYRCSVRGWARANSQSPFLTQHLPMNSTVPSPPMSACRPHRTLKQMYFVHIFCWKGYQPNTIGEVCP